MRLATAILFFTVIALCGFAHAQIYPTKPVRVINPYPPGGAADIIARQITQKLSQALGTQFIVDNRSGAGGAIGSEMVARAVPDGHTLLFGLSGAMSINPHILAKSPYDPLRDFSYIILAAYTPMVLVVNPGVPAKTVKELIAFAKMAPRPVRFASNGLGTLSHITGELFAQRAAISMVHIPYKGAAPAVIDTLSGDTSVLFAGFPSISAQVRAGKLRALAVTSGKRMPVFPDLPTVAEDALPGFESNQWWGIYGPTGLSATVIGTLNSELNKILQAADIQERLAADGASPGGGSPDDLATYLQRDYEQWGRVIKAAGIKGE
jgi:tripartite-type tricarboxylate transporter receptor subunit TctC